MRAKLVPFEKNLSWPLSSSQKKMAACDPSLRFLASAWVAVRLLWHALNNLSQQAQLVSMGADVQQDSIQTHSGVCTEANLHVLH